jgi:hypothetical protein
MHKEQPTAIEDTTDQDTVTSWLQNLEMKDSKLGAARNNRARMVEVTTAIDRLLDKACETFPHLHRALLEQYVRAYIDPQDRLHGTER